MRTPGRIKNYIYHAHEFYKTIKKHDNDPYPSYKLEKEVIDAEIEIMKIMGVEIKCGVEVGKDVTIESLIK